MKYSITHKTTYSYSEPASLSQNELFLHPRETANQRVLNNLLAILPEPQYNRRRYDYFGNITQVFMVQQPHDELVINAMSTVETYKPVTPLPDTTPPWESVARQLSNHQQKEELEAFQFVFASPLIALERDAKAFAELSFPPGIPVLSGAIDLIQRIFTEFSYDKSATTVDTSVEHILSNRKGVCQDFAHLAISCLRTLGLAARYVSGYIETKPPPGKPKLIGADASHAWVSLYVPEGGWVDLDPTNNLIPGENHVTLAWGRDYGDVTPVKGVVMGGGTHKLSVKVDVSQPLNNNHQ
jgi:transglutaminase-like putative cysteine protease